MQLQAKKIKKEKTNKRCQKKQLVRHLREHVHFEFSTAKQE